MVAVDKAKQIFLNWKKTFIGSFIAILITILSVATGLIKIYEAADDFIRPEGPAEVPIHDHVTFQTNRILKAINKDTVKKNTKKSLVYEISDSNNVNSIKQIPSKRK